MNSISCFDELLINNRRYENIDGVVKKLLSSNSIIEVDRISKLVQMHQVNSNKDVEKLIGKFLYESSKVLKEGKKLDSNTLELLSTILSNYQKNENNEDCNNLTIGKYHPIGRYYNVGDQLVIDHIYLDEAIHLLLLNNFSFPYERHLNSNSKMLEIDVLELYTILESRVLSVEGTALPIDEVLRAVGLSVVEETQNKNKLYLTTFIENILSCQCDIFSKSELTKFIHSNTTTRIRDNTDIVLLDVLTENVSPEKNIFDNLSTLIENRKVLTDSSCMQRRRRVQYLNSEQLKFSLGCRLSTTIDKACILENKPGNIKIQIKDFANKQDICDDDSYVIDNIITIIDNLTENQISANTGISELLKFISCSFNDMIELLEMQGRPYSEINRILSLMLLCSGATFSNSELFDNYVEKGEVTKSEKEESFDCIIQVISHLILRRLGKMPIYLRTEKYREKVYLFDLFTSAVCSKYYQYITNGNTILDFMNSIDNILVERIFENMENGVLSVNLNDIVREHLQTIGVEKLDSNYAINSTIRKYISMVYPSDMEIYDIFESKQLNIYNNIPEHSYFEDHFENKETRAEHRDVFISRQVIAQTIESMFFECDDPELLSKNELSSIITLQILSNDLKINSKTYKENKLADKLAFMLYHLTKEPTRCGIREVNDIFSGIPVHNELTELFEDNYIESDFHENIQKLSQCDINQDDYNEYRKIIQDNKFSNSILEVMKKILECRYKDLSEILPVHCNYRFIDLYRRIDCSSVQELRVINMDLVQDFCNMYERDIPIPDFIEFVLANEYYHRGELEHEEDITETETYSECNSVISNIVNVIENELIRRHQSTVKSDLVFLNRLATESRFLLDNDLFSILARAEKLMSNHDPLLSYSNIIQKSVTDLSSL